MKRFSFIALLVMTFAPTFAYQNVDWNNPAPTVVGATFYTQAGDDRAITNGWATSKEITNKNNVYFMSFQKGDGSTGVDTICSPIFSKRKNQICVLMEICMPSGGTRNATLLGMNATNEVVETLD